MEILNPHQRYLVDEKGKRVAVLLGIEEYRKMLADLEELESIRLYDAAKKAKDKAIPFEKAVKEIEQGRR